MYKKILIAVLVVVFCSGTSYAEKTFSRTQNGGKAIPEGQPNAGQVGYQLVKREEDKKSITIYCSGGGLNTCPATSIGPDGSDPYGEVIAKVCEFIDLGQVEGYFVVDDFDCTWDNGEKNEDEDEEGFFIYGYHLVIKHKLSAIVEPFVLTTTINAVQDNLLLHFSTTIGGTLNVQIFNETGGIVWEQEQDVTSDQLLINIEDLEAGTYTVRCSYEDYEAEASFTKTVTAPELPVITNVFPNPVGNQFTVHFSKDIVSWMQIKIVGTGTGQWDFTNTITGNILTLDVNFLPAGTYMIICTNDDVTMTAPFIKL